MLHYCLPSLIENAENPLMLAKTASKKFLLALKTDQQAELLIENALGQNIQTKHAHRDFSLQLSRNSFK